MTNIALWEIEDQKNQSWDDGYRCGIADCRSYLIGLGLHNVADQLSKRFE